MSPLRVLAIGRPYLIPDVTACPRCAQPLTILAFITKPDVTAARANMRAASDETAMMDQSDSVVAVSSAVSQAAEHVERARDAVRVLNASVSRN
jgi:hypothetical protein